MIRLFALRAFIALWTRAIALSKKLSPKAWKLLAAFQACILALSVWGLIVSIEAPVEVNFKASVPAHSDTNSTVIYMRPDDKPLNAIVLPKSEPTFFKWEVVDKTGSPSYAQTVTFSESCAVYVAHLRYSNNAVAVNSANSHLHFSMASIAKPMVYGHTLPTQALMSAVMSSEDRGFSFRENPIFPSSTLPGFRKFFEPVRSVIVQPSQSGGGDYKTAIMFWVMLFSTITSTLSTISTGVIAWISVNHARAEHIRKQAEFAAAQRAQHLELERMHLENERLRLEVEKMRREAEQKPSLILLASS